MKEEIPNLFMITGYEINGKAGLTGSTSSSLVEEKKFDMNTIIRELGKEINGSGGGQAFYATAGGSNISGINNALEKAKTYLDNINPNNYPIY